MKGVVDIDVVLSSFICFVFAVTNQEYLYYLPFAVVALFYLRETKSLDIEPAVVVLSVISVVISAVLCFLIEQTLLIILIVAPILEELTIRGVLWDVLQEIMNDYACAVLTGVLFGLWHIMTYENQTLVVVIIISVLLSFLRVLTDVYFCAVVHRLINIVAVVQLLL